MDCDMVIAFLLFFLFVYFQCVVINRIVSDSAAWSLELRFERGWGFWMLIYSQTWSREPPRIGFPETSIIILPQANYTHLTYDYGRLLVQLSNSTQYNIQLCGMTQVTSIRVVGQLVGKIFLRNVPYSQHFKYWVDFDMTRTAENQFIWLPHNSNPAVGTTSFSFDTIMPISRRWRQG